MIEHTAAGIECRLEREPDVVEDRSALRMAAMLTRVIAEDYERAADVMVTEHTELTDLFSRATRFTEHDPHLARDLAASVGSQLASLRISALSERSDAELSLLIRLHATLDDSTSREPGAASLLDEIWSFLDRYVEHRRYFSAP